MEIKRIDLKFVPLYIICIIFCINNCNTTPNSNMKKETTEVITYKTVLDTVPFYVTTPVEVPVEVTIPVYKTFWDTIKQESVEVKEYNNPFEDSLLSGNIMSKITLDGTLVNQNFTYTPKFPKYIKQIDSVFVERTTTAPNKFGVYTGLGCNIGEKSFGLVPKIGFETQNHTYIEAGYDIVNNSYQLSLTKRIKLK